MAVRTDPRPRRRAPALAGVTGVVAALLVPATARSNPCDLPPSPVAERDPSAIAKAGKYDVDALRARAARVPAIKEELRQPSTLVISGGVSLGSYQAGFLHYYTEFLLGWRDFLKQRFGIDPGRRGAFRIATGASAGSINAFLAVVAGCQAPRPDPEQSLFFNTWIPVGIAELAQESATGERSLFTRAPIDAAVRRIEDLWSQAPRVAGWSSRECQGFLGMTVTRVKGREMTLPARSAYEGRVTVNRQSEKFLLSVHGRGGFAPPVFEPVVLDWREQDPDGWRNSLYPVLGDGKRVDQIDLRYVMDLLRASSAFPVAFEPLSLPYSFWKASPTLDAAGRVAGTLAEPEQAEFLDGGVFDNTPLLLAQRMATWIAAYPDPASGDGLPPATTFLEPDAIGWRKCSPPAPPPTHQDRSIFGVYAPFVAEFVRTARGAELLAAIENGNGDMARETSIPPRMMPLAGAQLLNFLGFFERSFRVFDFYMGMVDAWEYLRGNSTQYRIMEQDSATRHRSPPMPVDSRTFDCFREFRVRVDQGQVLDPATLPACASLRGDPRSPEARNLLALLATSWETKSYTRSPGYDPEGEDDFFFEALGRHGFRFVDLPAVAGKSVGADDAQDVIRQVVQDRLQRLSLRQPHFWQELPTAVVTKAAANLFRYQVPRLTFDFGFVTNRGLEIGFTKRLGYTRWTLAGGVRWQPLERVVEDPATRAYAAFMISSPFARFGWEPLVNPWLQLHLGAGWTAALYEHWSPFLESMAVRHGPQGSAGISIVQRFYVTAFASYFLDDCATNPACSNLTTPLPLLTDRIGWAFTAGFRLTVP
ncbi:MAG: patatin-like phospholipase family protein [Gemmatimonadales bacterium]